MVIQTKIERERVTNVNNHKWTRCVKLDLYDKLLTDLVI